VSSNVIKFQAPRPPDVDAPSSPIGEPNDYFTHLFSKSFFRLPFVTLPEDPGDCWGEFWKRVDMWNDKPTDNSCTDYHRGRKYAEAAVEALSTERVSTRQLEIVVERMIERAFRRRGPKGKLCRGLSSAEHGFLMGLCKIAVKGRARKAPAPIGQEAQPAADRRAREATETIRLNPLAFH
jgi:hypothetical protein